MRLFPGTSLVVRSWRRSQCTCRTDPKLTRCRPQGDAGWSHCPQVDHALCPPAVRTGTLYACGSWFPRRRPPSSLPPACPSPPLFPPITPGRCGQVRPVRRARRVRPRPYRRRPTRWRSRAPIRLPEEPPASHLAGPSSGRWPHDRQSFADSSLPGASGRPGTAASTCREPSVSRCSAQAKALWPSQA